MAIRLPISRARVDFLADWLEERTGVEARYFKTKLTNKFPGISEVEADEGVSGLHLYLEATDISSETIWFGKLDDLRSDDQDVFFTIFAPKDFTGSRYFQYVGEVSGVPDLSYV